MDWYPCLHDRTSSTGVDPQYFHQANWAIGRIARLAPEAHLDVGSDVRYVGALAALFPVTFVDIRPLTYRMENLTCTPGSVTALPYADGAWKSVSCMHVLEHIGLGRYGDPLQQDGPAVAARELSRVLAPGGKLFLSLPMGATTRVQFNAQWSHCYDDVLKLFPDLQLEEISLVTNQGKAVFNVSPNDIVPVGGGGVSGSDFFLGMFVFSRPTGE